MKALKISKRKSFELYAITQCALYKLTSPAKLIAVLNSTEVSLGSILASDENYRQFTLLEEVNPFSGKITKARLVQTPARNLRSIHERILKLLQRVRYPEYAHAGVKKRSYRSNAKVHESSRTVATFDLKNFYGSTSSFMVREFFTKQLNCVGDVAGMLTALTTFHNCLPTGSPLSPLLALYTAKPMFDALELLAKKYNLKFTCYVDDLTFSGDALPPSLARDVKSIVVRHGYKLSEAKTRIYRSDQAKHVTGTVIVNNKIRVPHVRFLTARNIQSALDGDGDNHGFSNVKLTEKLAGLMNEASYLDHKFHEKALMAHAKLRAERARL
ncbi:reverse transcriptase family protein [Pseudomonas mandelii]|uniref:reverse transcriptase family protein n=1 Tax=Pseudomonas mandelii TaxID=75612 RepID=UPI003C792DD1